MDLPSIPRKPFLQEAQKLYEYTQRLRRDFHRFPELGFQEERTSRIIARELESLDVKVRSKIAETGITGLIQGASPGPVVMLRFDMDALPIQEETGAEYASQNPGVMHACGHDGHVAIGLTVARMLADIRESLSGTVKLVFQPAEEGLGGAERMIAEGILEDPNPDFALGLHLWNEKPLGWIGVTPGPIMAAADIFKIEVFGKGGHGAQPHLAVDPLVASAYLVCGLQSVVSRNISPLQTAVISVTTIHSGEAFNVIPSRVTLQGTIRTFERNVRERVIERFEKVIYGTADVFGCRAELDLKSLTPAVVNDEHIAERVAEMAREILPGSQIELDFRTMGSEDMAFFLQETPGCFFFVGSANTERGLDAPHHHPAFDFDEQALTRAAALMTCVATSFLTPEMGRSE
jgi:amidohydrolase